MAVPKSPSCVWAPIVLGTVQTQKEPIPALNGLQSKDKTDQGMRLWIQYTSKRIWWTIGIALLVTLTVILSYSTVQSGIGFCVHAMCLPCWAPLCRHSLCKGARAGMDWGKIGAGGSFVIWSLWSFPIYKNTHGRGMAREGRLHHQLGWSTLCRAAPWPGKEDSSLHSTLEISPKPSPTTCAKC